ncbi:MAG: inorganic phosphate transporter [Hyphomicrobiales bacterium]
MDSIYLIILIVLFILAISDLIVGVSNDAVNFLNSAVGAKAAPFKVIVAIAAVGVLVGATFSSGLMEVARKGIFNPGTFYFDEIMLIFLAVMITDVLLLDMFNTFGLPTSTTVSIVFELLGASVGIALIKIMHGQADGHDLGYFINSSQALAIISGILLSVVVAFVAGVIVQFFTRIVFSFNYKKKMKRFGAIWGGIAITAITYFILIKGAKNISFIGGDIKDFIMNHTAYIMGISFVFWAIILQLLYALFKIDILKFIVLIGTFALAMAFAGNDLVNFIGVPLAGLASFNFFSEASGADPNSFLMTALAGKVKTPTYLLLIAGLIMVLTLYFNKKARSVIKTTLDLSRQNEGTERFGSTFISRSLVRSTMNVFRAVRSITPKSVQNKISQQYAVIEEDPKGGSFDMIRASVNLVVASILISFATSLGLPLSTTYVTFMVAMGTSLSDRAWGRESAVYRITGVLSVVGGWFFTAFIAFTVAFLVALFFNYGGMIAIVIMIIVAAFMVIRTHAIHKLRAKKAEEEAKNAIDEQNVVVKCKSTVEEALESLVDINNDILTSVMKEKLKLAKKSKKKAKEFNHYTKDLKNNVHKTVAKLQREDSDETGLFYIQIVDYLREISHSMTHIVAPCFEHIDNNHKPFSEGQVEEVNRLRNRIQEFLLLVKDSISNDKFDNEEDILNAREVLMDRVKEFQKNQIKRIKKDGSGTRNSLLFFNILDETKHLLLHITNLYKAQRDFIKYSETHGS